MDRDENCGKVLTSDYLSAFDSEDALDKIKKEISEKMVRKILFTLRFLSRVDTDTRKKDLIKDVSY